MSIVDELRYSNFRGNAYLGVIKRFTRYLFDSGEFELSRMLNENLLDANETIEKARAK